VPVGAAPTCALIANGVSRRFSRFECKSEEKKNNRATPRGRQRGTHVLENWLQGFS
jgi:hypothetical protein